MPTNCPRLPLLQFLPPLLVDTAIRIDFFMFSKVGGRQRQQLAVAVLVAATHAMPCLQQP